MKSINDISFNASSAHHHFSCYDNLDMQLQLNDQISEYNNSKYWMYNVESWSKHSPM